MWSSFYKDITQGTTPLLMVLEVILVVLQVVLVERPLCLRKRTPSTSLRHQCCRLSRELVFPEFFISAH